MSVGESCYINIDTGNSSYRDPSALTADAAGGCHGNVVCSITLTNPIRYYNDRLLDNEAVTSRDDDSDDGGSCHITALYVAYVSYNQ